MAAVAAAVALFGMRRADPDLWGYLDYGRYFWGLGYPTSVDVFSYTCRDCTWIHFEWLAHVSLWLAYDVAGPVGLIALKCLVGGVCLWYVFAAVSRASETPAAWLPAYLLVLGILPRYFLFRPQIFTFAFLAFFVDTLWRHLAGNHRRLWLLPLAMAFWANLHGGFLAGLGVIGLGMVLSAVRQWNAGGPRRFRRACASSARLGLVLVACAVGSLANPLGWRLWTYLVTELTHDTNRRFIAEWRPLFSSRDYWTITTTILLLSIVVVGSVVAQRKRASPVAIRPWQWLLACAPLAIMSVQSVRHVPILAIWAAPVLAVCTGALVVAAPAGPWRVSWPALRAAMILPVCLTSLVVLRDPGLRISLPRGVLGSAEPFGIVAYMRATGLRGNAFVPLWWGSYVTSQLNPGVLVSMDGRNVSLYPREMVLENLVFYSSGSADPGVPARYDTHYLMMPRNAPVFSRVSADARWRPVFEDADAVLFARADRARAGHIRTLPADRFARPSTF